MQNPVENSAGNERISEDLPPVSVVLVGSQDYRAFLIAPGDQLKEQICSQPVNRDIPDFINDQKLGLGELLELFVEPSFLMDLDGFGAQDLGDSEAGNGEAPPGRVYSVHEPNIACITKNKAVKKQLHQGLPLAGCPRLRSGACRIYGHRHGSTTQSSPPIAGSCSDPYTGL